MAGMDAPQNRIRLPRWAAMAIIVLLAAALLWNWRQGASARQPEHQTAVAQIADIERTVLASGTIHPLRMVNVGAQASGRIERLHVQLGQHVKRGQLIAEIDPSTQVNALKSAEATLARLKAQRTARSAALHQADRAFRREQQTFAQEASSKADLELAEANHEMAQADVIALDAEIRQAIATVDTARVNLGYTRVLAPIDGTVIAIATPEGQTVNAVQAAPTIVRLANLDTMTVKTRISEADVIDVRPGQSLYFTILGAPRRRYHATLRAIEPAPEGAGAELDSAASGAGQAGGGANAAAIYYNGLFEIANPGLELRPSMTAQVNIVLAQTKNALSIPVAALGGEAPDARRLVRVIDATGVVKSRAISVGIDNGTLVQVTDGLKAGERVVLGETGLSAS